MTESCEVLIAGGGPAGSTCAWKLKQAGLDVMVVDAAAFPRDKVCAGWITTQVVDDLQFDVQAYRRTRTFQPITGFLTGVIGGGRELETGYGHAVSYGIRRYEFDDYLLQRSGARLRLGTPITHLRRDGSAWIVNDQIRASMLVGAGGHRCPIAQQLNGALPLLETALVVAQETEFPIEPRDAASFTTRPETPELFFSRDLKGYGWCFRKQDFINIGFGSLERRALPQQTAAFLAYLVDRGKVPPGTSWHWRGHAYLLHEKARRRVIDDGVVLIGDAAGLAYPQSGEGIRPAIESGLLAASVIAQAAGRYTRDRLAPYEKRLRERFSVGSPPSALSRLIPPAAVAHAARALLRVPPFVRHVVLDRWFLHAHDPALSPT